MSTTTTSRATLTQSLTDVIRARAARQRIDLDDLEQRAGFEDLPARLEGLARWTVNELYRVAQALGTVPSDLVQEAEERCLTVGTAGSATAEEATR